jgi:hypothetical protein
MTTKTIRITAAASLVVSTVGFAYWMYRNRSSNEKTNLKEERYKLVEEFAELNNCKTLIITRNLNF